MFWKVNKRGFHKVLSFLRFSDIALVIIRKIWNHPLNFAEFICINLKYYKSTSQICCKLLMMIKKNFQILWSFNWKKKSVFTCDTCVTLYIMLNQISCKRIILSYRTGNNNVAFELYIFNISSWIFLLLNWSQITWRLGIICDSLVLNMHARAHTGWKALEI